MSDQLEITWPEAWSCAIGAQGHDEYVVDGVEGVRFFNTFDHQLSTASTMALDLV